MRRTGAQILVDQLLVHGADTAFCVPGESYLAVLDALRDAPIRLVVARHEAGAANMAEAYGKLTGRPGICLVTRAPGATQASVGIFTAFQDSSPTILLVGQVPRAEFGREGFQELDHRRMFDEMAKWAAQLDDPARTPEVLARAFHTATSGRPGPVVIALPEDVLFEEADVADAARYRPAQPRPAPGELEQMRELLARAERPLAIVGGGGWSADAARDMVAFAEANELPVAVTFRRQDYVDNRSRVYAGDLAIAVDPALAKRVQDADLLLVVGSRLGSISTKDYTLVEPPRPRQTLVHVHPDPDEPGRVFQPELAIVAGSPQFAAAASALDPVDGSRWAAWTESARADYLATLRQEPAPGELDLAEVVKHLSERLPEDAIIANGAGNYTAWFHRFFQFKRYRTQLAPASGAMGYGMPAAVAAKVVHPERLVVCVTGDGDFMMSGHELATMVQEELPIVVLLVNNGMYGTIRMHQERNFPGRVVATDLVNPDFPTYAAAFGAYGAAVARTADFAEAFEQALAEGRPALLELRVDPEAITPRATLSAIRAAASR